MDDACLSAFLIQFGESRKIANCSNTELKSNAKKVLNLPFPTILQRFCKNFEEWVDVENLENISPNSKLQIATGKNSFL